MRWLSGHKGDVRAVAYTPAGQLVSGGSDKTVRVWDLATGDCVRTLKAAAPVYAVAVSPDGRTTAYAGRYAPRAESNAVYLLDPTGAPAGSCGLRIIESVYRRNLTGGMEQVRALIPRSIWSLAWSADGRYLAAACRRLGPGNHLNGAGGRVWEMTGTPAEHELPGRNVNTVAFAPAGYWLALTREGSVHFLENPRATDGLSYPVTGWSLAVVFVPGADLAVAASNSFLHFVNPIRREKPTRVKTGVRTVSALAVSPDGRTVLAGGRPGTVEVYDPVARTRITTYDFGIGGVHGLAFAPDGLTFAVAGDKGLVVCDAAA